MDEAPVTDVDAHVRMAALHGVEENKVARLQLTECDGAGAVGDLRRVVGQAMAADVLDDVGDHAAAIQTGFRIASAELVAGVEQAKGEQNHFARLFVVSEREEACVGYAGPLWSLGCGRRLGGRAAACKCGCDNGHDG